MLLPEEFLKNMKYILGDDFDEYIKSLSDEKVSGIRINTLKINVEEFLDKNIFEVEQIPWCNTGFYYKNNCRPAKHPYYNAGLYYLQEPSAMSPAALIDIKQGDRVLDMCAAPGGKSTQVAARLNGTGVIVSNDISPSRAKALIKNIENSGIRNAVVMSENPAKLSERFTGFFDKIIIDAPCSGEGMFRKDSAIIKSWNKDMIDFCCQQQKSILDSAAKMLKCGGQIFYSTCTFNTFENEKTINDFLNSHNDFYIEPIKKYNGFCDGMPELIENGLDELKGCARLFPNKIKGEGHFLCKLIKKGLSDNIVYDENKSVPDKDIKLFNEFKSENIDTELNGVFQMFKDELYLLPKELPSLKGLRVLRSGWRLGNIKKNRFEPSQAFAMGLKYNEVKNKISFSLCHENITRYLRGETIDICDEKSGWQLFCVDGFPLGWGKAQNGRLKNKLPAGWINN